MKHQVVILSTADFDSSVWTNKQHLAVGIAERHDVIYIESMGLREPRINLGDVRRVCNRLLRKVKKSRINQVVEQRRPDNIEIVSPMVIPFHRFAAVRRINQRLLRHQISALLDDSKVSTLWTFSPLTYGVEDLFDNAVYHSVDLLHTLPMVPEIPLLKAEIDLVTRVDHIIASSRGVEEHLSKLTNRPITLWENVAHAEMFSAAISEHRLDQVVFAGNLTPSKMDVECLESIVAKGVSLVLAGPMEIDGSASGPEIERLLDHPLVKYVGNLPLNELAILLGTSKVGLIPYQINDYTRGVFPMKVYEYLAAGLGVVSTHLPSLRDRKIPNLNMHLPGEFGDSVVKILSEYGSDYESTSVDAAKDHSWKARISQACDLVELQVKK